MSYRIVAEINLHDCTVRSIWLPSAESLLNFSKPIIEEQTFSSYEEADRVRLELKEKYSGVDFFVQQAPRLTFLYSKLR